MKLETVASLTLVLTTLTMCPSHCGAFVTPINDLMRSMARATISLQPLVPQLTTSYSRFTNSIRESTRLYAIPTLDNWVINNKGEATGRVSNHPNPNIFDGEMVTTSPLQQKNVDLMKQGSTVVTASGSRYKLGKPKNAPAMGRNFGRAARNASSASATAEKPKPARSTPSMSFGGPANWGNFNNGKAAPRAGKAPLMNDWFISFRGELIGVVSGHPNRSIADGDTLTTSKIEENRNSIKQGDIVTTANGSKYLLGTKKRGIGSNFFKGGVSSESAEANGGTFNSGVKTSIGESQSSSSSSRSFSLNGLRSFQLMKPQKQNQSQSSEAESSSNSVNISSTFGLLKKQLSEGLSNVSSSSSSSQLSPSKLEKQKAKNLKQTYGINGKTLANGKYLLCDRARRSTSGKSNIWSAYLSDKDGNPVGEKLTIKVSTNFDSMSREERNYNRVCSGLFPGRFVEKTEFLEDLDGYPAKEFETSCALVIENGRKDLRAILNERGGQGFEGRAMRDAASAALQCIQAMHSSGIVWTDLKTENFVVVSDEIGYNDNLPGVKGIDLESAIPKGKNPVDFSPEACPPEFATAFIAGEGLEFKLDYSYDIWSYGMMLYELTTGQPYFNNKTPAQITMSLQYEFTPDLSAVSDDKLRDLIRLCLQYNPKKRPGVTQLLLHPYFLSSGLGPFGW
eukprot:CAMPEP_0203684332 /NCGR_PEP_ID=MMETSP0090-20130426/47984_1 /ASSEMBLY_ACC=CAM_ASM_001088 /TAXON_ID=426623 /ORGANISM="Chaetoceros affinis, Strain CCMP159" /LENGTH=679 /DNA_ID=CAMNT_0050553503 /DNA_START=72 /DNA_END=2111 /DNA_ORIENTATION=-